MKAKELYAALSGICERQGYFFNKDLEGVTMPLLENLLFNKERYGYMACPCRLASGDFSADRDIVCPCEYRAKDVEEYHSCYCGLYVSKQWSEGGKEKKSVPERRPVEKMPF